MFKFIKTYSQKQYFTLYLVVYYAFSIYFYVTIDFLGFKNLFHPNYLPGSWVFF